MKLIPSRQDLLLAPQIESIRQRLERWRRNRKQQTKVCEALHEYTRSNLEVYD